MTGTFNCDCAAPLPLMTAAQISRAAVAFTFADDPSYMAGQLRVSFDLSPGQWVALRELAKLEQQRRVAA